MARNFVGIPVYPPQTSLQAMPLQLFAPDMIPAKEVSFFIDWKIYNGNGTIPALGIQPNLGAGLQGQATLDKICSVVIDNSNSNVPVYVYFPDTLYTVACGPGGQLTENVVTASLSPIVYAAGFTGGVQPQSIVYFSNRVLQPAQGSDTNFVLPQYMASSSNPNVANNTAYRALALGDRMLTASYNVVYTTAAGTWAVQGTGGTAYKPWTWPNGFSAAGCYAYITAFQLQLTGSVGRASAFQATAENLMSTFGFWDTAGSTMFAGDFSQVCLAGAVNQQLLQNIVSWTGLQIKVPCDNTNTFRFGYLPAALGGLSDNYLFYTKGSTASAYDNVSLRATMNFTIRDETQNPI